jgi:hypothetical protein
MLMGFAVIGVVGFISFRTDGLAIEMCQLIVASQIQDLMTPLPRKRKQQVSLKNNYVSAKLCGSTSTNTSTRRI